MKKYLSLITILIINSYVLAYSQNAIDPPVLPSGINDTVFSFDNTNIIHRMDDKFILGWNYGGPGRAMDSLMKSNHYLDHWETGMTITWANYGDNHNWYIRLWPLTTGTDASIVETQALYYEPSINVESINISKAPK